MKLYLFVFKNRIVDKLKKSKEHAEIEQILPIVDQMFKLKIQGGE